MSQAACACCLKRARQALSSSSYGSAKAKYQLGLDSEQVQRCKGEKYFDKRVKQRLKLLCVALSCPSKLDELLQARAEGVNVLCSVEVSDKRSNS